MAASAKGSFQQKEDSLFILLSNTILMLINLQYLMISITTASIVRFKALVSGTQSQAVWKRKTLLIAPPFYLQGCFLAGMGYVPSIWRFIIIQIQERLSIVFGCVMFFPAMEYGI